jgi:hypothetical protein
MRVRLGSGAWQRLLACATLTIVAFVAGPTALRPQPSGAAYDPPAGVYPYFPSSPFLTRIPVPAPVNPNSAAWVANASAIGPFGIAGSLYAYDAPNWREIAFPIYLAHAGSDTPVRIHCTKRYGGDRVPCNIEGMTVYVDAREVPQNGGLPADHPADAHWALIDEAAGYEYDAWNTQWPPKDGVLTVGWGGRCSLAGNGFTNASYQGPHWNSGCVGTTSGTPQSLGIVRAKDLLAAAKNGGALPAALSLVYGCTGISKKLADPFLSGGDGHCAGAVPEGTRMYLAMHDGDIDALGIAPIVAALLRTLDEDHFGGFIVDSADGPKPGFGLNVESDSTYTAFGLPGPWKMFLDEAGREGLQTFRVPFSGRTAIRLAMPDAVTWDKVRFW